MYDKPSAPSKKINHANMVESDCKGFGNKVGVYSNHATVLEAMRGLFTTPETQAQRDEIDLRKKLLREIIGAEIDSTKGLDKPKEPNRFTHFAQRSDDDDEETKKKKYFHNSLVISKKPYFFRYLYPELNQRYKKYEASYNDISRCMFREKFKKLLVKQNKTEEEKNVIRRYHRFSPLINTNCTMNLLCRKVEEIDFDIKYDKNCVSLLPHYDLSTFAIDELLLKQFRQMYQKYSNKKIISYINYLFVDYDDDEFKEIRFDAIDAIKDEIKQELEDTNLSTMEALTYIKTLSLSYAKFNWAFAWDILGDRILDVIDESSALAPVENENGQEYLGHKYVLVEIPKESKNYTINENTGEVEIIYEENCHN